MDWNKLQSKIKDKLDGIGMSMTVITITHGAYQIDEGTRVETRVSHSIYGIMIKYSEEDIRKGLAQVGDKKILLNASDIPNIEQYDSIEIQVAFADEIGYLLTEKDGFLLTEDEEAIFIEGNTNTLYLNPIKIGYIYPAGVGLLYKIHARG